MVWPDHHQQIIIKELQSLGGPHPWQWEGITDKGEFVYIRERCSILRIDVDGVVFMLLKGIGNFDGYDDLVDICQDVVQFPAL